MKYFQANALHAAGQLPLMQPFVMTAYLYCIHLITSVVNAGFLYPALVYHVTDAKENFLKE